MKLFLDDYRQAPKGWFTARSVEDAIIAFLTSNIEQLSLDYDLDEPNCDKCQFSCGLREGGCQHSCPCHENGKHNGMDLLRWIDKAQAWPMVKPVVHSANTEAAPKMKTFIDERFPDR